MILSTSCCYREQVTGGVLARTCRLGSVDNLRVDIYTFLGLGRRTLPCEYCQCGRVEYCTVSEGGCSYNLLTTREVHSSGSEGILIAYNFVNIVPAISERQDSSHITPSTTQLRYDRLRRCVHHPERWMQRVQPEIFIYRNSAVRDKGVPTRRPVLIIDAIVRGVLVSTSLRISAGILQDLFKDRIRVEDECRSILVSAAQVRCHLGDIGVV